MFFKGSYKNLVKYVNAHGISRYEKYKGITLTYMTFQIAHLTFLWSTDKHSRAHSKLSPPPPPPPLNKT